MQFCKCIPDALRLISLGYWPATPTRPVLAFTHPFMEWMEALLLECQVSIQDFSSAVEMLIKEKYMKVSLFYKSNAQQWCICVYTCTYIMHTYNSMYMQNYFFGGLIFLDAMQHLSSFN